MPRDDEKLRTIWRRFRLGGELRPLVCLVATAAAGLLLAGIGVGAGWGFGMFQERPGPPGGRYGNVRDDHILYGVLAAGAVWLLLLLWLWRPAVKLRFRARGGGGSMRWSQPLVLSALLGAAVTVVSFVIHRQPWDDTEWAVTAISLLAAGAAVVLWLPAVFHLEQGRPVYGRTGSVNVFCADCGYSMVGLRETTCPECGKEYTIDELIEAQGYAVAESRDVEEQEESDDGSPP